MRWSAPGCRSSMTAAIVGESVRGRPHAHREASARVSRTAISGQVAGSRRRGARRAVTRDVRAFEASLARFLEAAPDAMVIAGRDGLIQLVNAQAARLFGYARGELIGQPVERLIPTRFGAAHPQH